MTKNGTLDFQSRVIVIYVLNRGHEVGDDPVGIILTAAEFST